MSRINKKGTPKAQQPNPNAETNLPESDSGTNVAAQASNEPTQVGIAMTQAEYEALQTELTTLKQQNAEFSEGWARERADFSNFKRRLEREQEQRNSMFTGNYVKKFLPVLDDMERALKARPTTGDESAWGNGVDLIYRKLLNILEMEGVKPISKDIRDFDPMLHEAISHEDNPDHASGEIIEVVQSGYMIGERVLRPALVRVAR